MSQIKTLYVFANMGYLNQIPKSGGQSSARRVMKGLEDRGFKIIPIRRHRAELEGRLLHIIEVMTFAVVDLLKIVAKMFFGKRKDSAFMHLTYAGPLVPYELILTLVMKMLGYKSLIYLQGGQVLEFYKNGSALHKKMFKAVMDLQSKVFFEGKESMQLAKNVTDTPLVYFPSFVYDEQILSELPQKDDDNIGLIYFGRIAPNKNIDIIIDTFELLCEKYDNIHLTLIGGVGQSKKYAEDINQRISDSKFSSKITRIGLSPYEKIQEMMTTHHFFVFPSKEKAEGHSNALNEAMSQGLIPIVSDYHFNRSIVGNDRLVVDGYDAQKYADRISSIISSKEMEKLSNEVRDRVVDNYSCNKVLETVKKEIISI